MVIRSFEKEDYLENSHLVLFCLIKKRSFEPFVCYLDLFSHNDYRSTSQHNVKLLRWMQFASEAKMEQRFSGNSASLNLTHWRQAACPTIVLFTDT